MSEPLLFDEFIDSGFAETESPFLTKRSRRWGRLVNLKASLVAALFLIIAFITSFTSPIVSNIFLVFVYFLAGVPSLISAIEDICNMEINIDVLMTLAAFLSVLIGSGLEGALLLVLFSLSGSIEETVTNKANSSLSHLKNLVPPKAFVVSERGMIHERSVKDISVNTPILIKTGEVVPLDGKVIDGISTINLVHLTGENLPVVKTIGDFIPAGARNLEGTLTLSVTHTSAHSTISTLVKLITQAQETKPKVVRWVDRFSQIYAISIILLAFGFASLLPLITSLSYLGVEGSIYRSLAFLIAASPCALVIAIPVGYLSAINACAKKGILLKGGVTLDAIARCNTIAFDKTGTLTMGALSCTKVLPLSGQSEEELNDSLSYALALERNSTHPIAKAIVDYTQNKNIHPKPISNYKSIPGYGVEAQTPSGIPLFMGRLNHLENDQQEGKLVAILKIGDKSTLFEFQDTPRPQLKSLISNLRKTFRILMLTGDRETSAKQIADTLGIQEVFANLTPEDKLNYISQLSANSSLIMVGDGINDAPSLAKATVGISMGKIGSTTAIDASDVVLLNDNLHLLQWLIKKAHATVRILKQNMCIACFAILFATTPALLGFIPLWLAVILHEGGTVLVGLNGLRLLKK